MQRNQHSGIKSNYTFAKEYISYTLILITLAICTYTIALVIKNRGTKYYYYINP